MIDTDKYEGHKPAPWVWDINGVGQYETLRCNELVEHYEQFGVKRVIASKVDAYDVPTAELVADAPLLLEEVKRLQRELGTQYEYIEWLEEFAPKAGEYNTAWDAYELAKGIHWTQMEEEE